MDPNGSDNDLKFNLAIIGLVALWLGAFAVACRLVLGLPTGVRGLFFILIMVIVSWLLCQLWGEISEGDRSKLWNLSLLLALLAVALLVCAIFILWAWLIDRIGDGWAMAVMSGVACLIATVWVIALMVLPENVWSEGEDEVDYDQEVEGSPTSLGATVGLSSSASGDEISAARRLIGVGRVRDTLSKTAPRLIRVCRQFMVSRTDCLDQKSIDTPITAGQASSGTRRYPGGNTFHGPGGWSGSLRGACVVQSMTLSSAKRIRTRYLVMCPALPPET